MPLPEPESDESEDEFVSRCMDQMHNDDELDNEFPSQDQKLAVCFSQFEDAQEESIEQKLNKLREMI